MTPIIPVGDTTVNILSNVPTSEEKDVEVRAYFERLGYHVGWDFSKREGAVWHEISDGKGFMIQIDCGVSLSAIRADFSHWHQHPDATKGVSNEDYTVRGPMCEAYQTLLKKVAETL